MFLLRRGSGPSPQPFSVSRVLPSTLVLVAALLSSGCAKHATQTSAADPRVANPPYRVAGDTSAKPDLEADGQEAQVPPLKKPRAEPDDPTEPYSPNYGSKKAAALGTPAVGPAEATPPMSTAGRAGLGPVVKGPMPHDLPPDFRRRLASAVGD